MRQRAALELSGVGKAAASRNGGAALSPTVQAIRAVPSPAWVPLLLLWLGIGETPKIVLVAIGAFFPVAAELIASSMGLGFLLIDSQNTGRTDVMLLAIILLAVLGKLSDALLALGENRLLAARR